MELLTAYVVMTQSGDVGYTLYRRKGMALRFAKDGDIVVEVSVMVRANALG